MMSLCNAQAGVLYVHNLRPLFTYASISEAAKYKAFMLYLYKFIMSPDLHNLTRKDGTKN